MEFENLIKQGNLSSALTDLQNSIKKNPSDSQLRIVLFQLSTILGEWEKATKQLSIAGEMSGKLKTFSTIYSHAILCEQFREQVFQGKKQPLVFGEPEEYIASLASAVEMTAAGKIEAAAKLFTKTTDSFPAIKGKINGREFEWITDMDNRIGPVFEIIMNGAYYWVPSANLKKISISRPSHLVDKVWINVDIILANDTPIPGLMPVRYPLTHTSPDSALLLSNQTIWDEIAPDYFTGKGQKMFATDNEEIALFDIREIEFFI